MSRKKIVNRFGAGLLASAMIASSGIASAAVSAGLSPVAAFAYGNGTVTITAKDNEAPATYKAYQVFEADVSKVTVGDAPDTSDEYRATHLGWASNDVQSAVTGFLANLNVDNDPATNDYDTWLFSRYQGQTVPQTNGTSVTVSAIGNLTNEMRYNPQNVADFIAEQINGSATAYGTNTEPPTKQGDSFAKNLAQALRTAGISATDITAGSPGVSLEQGYWLVVSNGTDVANGEAGSAPMWVAVPLEGVTITEKTDVATIAKSVQDNTDNQPWGNIADAGIGQDLNFKIDSTLPTNIDAFSSYAVSVSDVLPTGMALSSINDVHVSLAGVDITEQLKGAGNSYGSISYTNNTLTVSLLDAKSSFGIVEDQANDVFAPNVLDNKQFLVTYKAHLTNNTDAAMGNQAGNVNEATLTYAADPTDASLTKSISDDAKVITYQVTLNKVDKATRLPLNLAGFKIKTADLVNPLYVKQDGSLSANENDAYEFFTDAAGQLVIKGLDEGDYVIYETTAPDSYELQDGDISLHIDATKTADDGTLDALAATVSGGEGMVQGTAGANEDGFLATNGATGDVSFRTSDDKIVVLPLTGMKVRDAVLIGGVIIAGASIAVMVAKKKGKKQE